VRPLTADERATLEAGLRSTSAVTGRRGQILFASAAGPSTTTLACHLHCTDQTGRHAIHTFQPRGLAALQPHSSRPHTLSSLFDAGTCASLRALLHQRPRTFGKPTRQWTLALAAEISFAQGLTPGLVSDETIRLARRRLGVAWKRATQWITSPDPAYRRKKTTVVKLTREAPKAVLTPHETPRNPDEGASPAAASRVAAGEGGSEAKRGAGPWPTGDPKGWRGGGHTAWPPSRLPAG
jgi:hypothetical protein